MRGGVQQNFHGPVTIHAQAIATDDAIQNIGNIGNGTSLKEIAALLQESMELKRREVQDGLKAVEEIASEIPKAPEKRIGSLCSILAKNCLVLQIKQRTLQQNSPLICRRSLY